MALYRVDWHTVTATGRDERNHSVNVRVESDTDDPAAMSAQVTAYLRGRQWINPRSRAVVTRVEEV